MRATIERYVRTGYFDVVLTHHRWTLVNQSALPLIELAASMGLGVVNAAVFGGGILATVALASTAVPDTLWGIEAALGSDIHPLACSPSS
jgi:aryl-alcohol dehydrogenase-like predicted oxidoreductase